MLVHGGYLAHFSHGNIIKYIHRPFLSLEGERLYRAAKSSSASRQDVEAWRKHELEHARRPY